LSTVDREKEGFYNIYIDCGPEMIIHPSLLSLRLRIHDQYPDRGDKVEEILFGSLQAASGKPQCSHVQVGQCFRGTIAPSDA